MMRRMDVHEAANRRLKIIFDYFDYVYVSFPVARIAASFSICA